MSLFCAPCTKEVDSPSVEKDKVDPVELSSTQHASQPITEQPVAVIPHPILPIENDPEMPTSTLSAAPVPNDIPLPIDDVTPPVQEITRTLSSAYEVDPHTPIQVWCATAPIPKSEQGTSEAPFEPSLGSVMADAKRERAKKRAQLPRRAQNQGRRGTVRAQVMDDVRRVEGDEEFRATSADVARLVSDLTRMGLPTLSRY